MKRNLLYGLLGIWLIGLAACTDDAIGWEDGFGPGSASTLVATVEFKPLTAALQKSRTGGEAIKSIEDMCVLLYDSKENLVEKYPLSSGQFKVESASRDDSRTEKETPRATFQLTVPYGLYYAYVVANMGDLSGHAEAIKTVTGLKNISFDWLKEVGENNQMFGHFTLANEIRDEAPLLTIGKKSLQLHAWIRRAASKVTVAYDGSALEEGVFIYLKSIQIKDIPKSCLLGNKNVPAGWEQLIREGETITYAEGSAYDETWPARITKGRPYYPHDEKYDLKADVHSDRADALFFYENMQGEGKDKRQDADGDHELDVPGSKEEGDAGYKDDMLYGTYIEVQGYYRSIHPDRVGSGPIVYRFMLGKNVTTNYDAERNHHYKLTLKFNRFANDVDWHIDYEEEIPSIQVPEPYYISYLYNHSMLMPVKVNTASRKLVNFSAKVDTNAWAPHDAVGLNYYKAMDPMTPEGKSAALNPWNGFLSLRKTKQTVIPFAGDITACNAENKKYYEEHHRGDRAYQVTTGEYDSDADGQDGKYYVAEDPDEQAVNFRLPMYTRAKQLIIKTGYTGNNPYVAYRRRAVVTFTAELDDGRTIVKPATVLQVRRVVNPKGIWRKHNSVRPFHVVLKHLPSEDAQEFKTFTSEGAWKAYVVRGDQDFITLDGKAETSGSTGTPVDFTIGFKGTCSENESRCAVIRVEYHNYSCFHLIFVRQGSAPMALFEGGRKWHTCNMRTASEEAACPTEEGSLFKFGNWNQPIDASNNLNDKMPWINVTQADFKDHSQTPMLIAGTKDSLLWGDIEAQNHSGRFSDPTIGGKTVSVATYKDYNDLYLRDDIEQAYGVLYGDDATETLSKVSEVYGHSYKTHSDGNDVGSGYGMRGCFVYNTSESGSYSGRNLFFPIGVSGYGHRKENRGTEVGNGVLRYSAGQVGPMSSNIVYRPLFYDLYMRPGAVYWLKEQVADGGRPNDAGNKECIAWDFNYFTFDFNYLSSSNLFKAKDDVDCSDACFVRCVED